MMDINPKHERILYKLVKLGQRLIVKLLLHYCIFCVNNCTCYVMMDFSLVTDETFESNVCF